MTRVHIDECKYESLFTSENGTISLRIANGYDACVVLVYEDNANAKVNEQKVLDDL